MRFVRKSPLYFFVIGLLALGGAFLAAQSVQPDSITLSAALDKENLPVGQTPWLLVTLNNKTDRDLYLHGNWYHIHIEGVNGEPPTKFHQRMTTGKLLPGEAAPRADEFGENAIPAKGSVTMKFDLKYYYDLSVPGRYSVYVDIRNPLSGKFMRTKIAQFEIQAQ